jgi:hypothetical protein
MSSFDDGWDDEGDPKTWRQLALDAVEDLKNYALDSGPERRMVSYRAYQKAIAKLVNKEQR